MIYEPSEDSFLLQKIVAKQAKNKSVLDMGSGSGILAETAQKAGASSVFAVDIQTDVVEALQKKNLQAKKSDLFKELEEESFDLIIFNPPYLPEDANEDNESSIVTAGGKKGDEIILRFLEQAPKYLNADGVILLLVSSLTPQKRILAQLEQSELAAKTVVSEKLFMEILSVLEITRIKDNNE